MVIYKTKEVSLYEDNYDWYEYRKNGGLIIEYRCHRRLVKKEWVTTDYIIDSWAVSDPELPKWLRRYV